MDDVERIAAENRTLRDGLERIVRRDPGNIVRNDEDCERHTMWNIARYTLADADRLRVAQHLKQENAK